MNKSNSSTQTNKSGPTRTNTIVFSVLLIIILLLSLWLRLVYLNRLRWTYDEGIHVLLAQMLARGYVPYSELFVSYPPLYILSIKWVWEIFGTVESLKILMSLYTIAGLAGVALIAYRLGGVWAGITAPIFLSLEPEFFRGSRGVLTEVPSVGMATLAIALAAFYLWADNHKRARIWLICSGLALAASLMLKILSPFVIGLIPLMIIARQYQQSAAPKPNRLFWKNIIIDGVLWGLALIIPVLAFTLIYNLPALYDQVIRFRFASRDAYDGEVNNLMFVFSAIKANWVVSLLAIIGLWFLVLHRLRQGWFVIAWLILALIFALIQVPLREKHLPLLLPPMSILAGLGVAGFVTLARKYWPGRKLASITCIIVLTALTLAYARQSVQVFAGYSSSPIQYLNANDQALTDFIKTFTSPDDCIITDDPTLAFVSNRPVPPSLAEVSSARLRSGYLTEEMLIDIASHSDCQIVAPIARRLKRSAPGFIEWAKGNYLNLWLYDNETEVLVAKPVTHFNPQQPLNAQFEDQVELLGFDLSAVNNGQAYLSLYWRTLKPFDQDYTVFVHVRDNQNNTVINADHQAYNGLVPTRFWPVNEIVKDTIRFSVSQETPAGSFDIYVGMYLPDGFVRLPVTHDTSGENAVVIPGITVQ